MYALINFGFGQTTNLLILPDSALATGACHASQRHKTMCAFCTFVFAVENRAILRPPHTDLQIAATVDFFTSDKKGSFFEPSESLVTLIFFGRVTLMTNWNNFIVGNVGDKIYFCKKICRSAARRGDFASVFFPDTWAWSAARRVYCLHKLV